MADRGRGRGRGGYRGRGGHGRGRGDTNGRGGASGGNICHDFQRTGTCTRQGCRFSHDADSNGGGTNSKRAEETHEQQQARGNYNDFKKYLGGYHQPSDVYVMKQVWKGASAVLLEGDRDWMQQLARDIDESSSKCNGRAHLKAFVERKIKSSDRDDYIGTVKVFLDVLTHTALLNDMAVDTYVHNIYNFIGGSNGKRAFACFQHICEALVAAKVDGDSSIEQNILEQVLIKLSLALYELLKRDRDSRLENRLTVLVETMTNAAAIIPRETPSTAATIVNKYLGDIHQMISRQKGLLQEDDDSDDGKPTFVHAIASSYPRDLVIPNDRHDNDKKDIADIIIFPTRDEIMSDVKEFLPSTDPDQPHFITNQVERHIDTHFRLLRHDIFGDQKKALATFMHAVAEDHSKFNNPRVRLGDTRVNTYPNARVVYLAFEARKGLEALIQFSQPPSIRKKNVSERRTWWEDSKRLEEGALLSLIWLQGNVVEHMFLIVSHRDTRPDTKDGLAHRETMATITTKLLTQDNATLQKLLKLSLNTTQGILLEYPNVIPGTFVPILENLQAMQRLGRLPFRQWIIPDQHNGVLGRKIYHDVPAPLYARVGGFKFSLSPILNARADDIAIDASSSCDDIKFVEEIARRTQLDAGQCKALVAALTREFAFIQGPPGTGKSFVGLQIMRLLLNVKKAADLGPVVVVCYTNHALDQFLEHLISIGITKVIRMGGQSKSKVLEGYNLRDVAKTETKTKTEGYRSAMAYKDLEECEKDAKRSLGHLHATHRRSDWNNLSRHLSDKYPRISNQFRKVDEDGFRTVSRSHPFDTWRQNIPTGTAASTAPLDIARIIQKATVNVHSLQNAEKRALVAKWTDEVCQDTIASLSATVNNATETQKLLTDIHDESDRRVLQGADVVGVTTSGLARRISLLQHVRCKVIICEEAGEVMEPHMISAMLPTIEHCIQIGDHEQLRPTINNFKDLSLESRQGTLFKLDRSQFERLSVSEKGRALMPVAQLEVQRRMRPEVSTLIRETIYPRLVDHASTLHLDDVMGMRKNVFWLDHRHFENDKGSDIHHSQSSSNPWEVDLVHALVRHVVRQGIYRSSDIAVLTPYTGQLQKLRAAMRADFEIVLSDRDQEALEMDGFTGNDDSTARAETAGTQDHRRKPLQKKQLSDLLRIATVDNFQGEEAKIIIVSLVRSNEEKKVGFLKTSNRINVLLSRAQEGMYLVGNSETYSNVAMWQKVIDMLRAEDSIGDTLELCCPRHPEKILEVREPDDFKNLSPQGGCMEACTKRLTDCGHQCGSRCHSDAMHEVFKCEKPCQERYEACDHPCQKPTCGEDCGVCMVPTNNVVLPCGHVKNNIPCHKTLDLGSIRCQAPILKEVPDCKHNININCCVDVNKEAFKCPAPCGTLLSCGHPCPGTCGTCNTKAAEGRPLTKHLACTVKCGRKFSTCNHNCPRPCHDGTDCGLCQSPCEVRCKHSRCTLKCHEPCAPCTEKCAWSCEHQGSCTMPCAAPCDRLPCDERCTKLLPCGHQCPSLCGEDCPVDYCQECGMKLDEPADVWEFTPYRDIDLNDTPIVVLGCRHLWTFETLDGNIGLGEVYNVDGRTGLFASMKENLELEAKVPTCPGGCGVPIRQFVTQRYNRLINQAVMAEQTKRFIASGMQELQDLEGQASQLRIDLDDSREAVVPAFLNLSRAGETTAHTLDRTKENMYKNLQKRWDAAIRLSNHVKAFQKRSSTKHQPSNKLQDAIAHFLSHKANLDDAMAGLSLSTPPAAANAHPDLRINLGSRLLELNILCIILEDKFDVTRLLSRKFPEDRVPLKLVDRCSRFLGTCEELAADCASSDLPKLAVESILYYARIAQTLAASGLAQDADRTKAMQYRVKAKQLLDQAEQLCKKAFRDRDALLKAIKSSRELLDREFYEKVTAAELRAIKEAMVTGRGGIVTHSGHWYKCVKGHPFAIGECGMPMQQARCPECGSKIGGQNHTAVEGVTRDEDMENV